MTMFFTCRISRHHWMLQCCGVNVDDDDDHHDDIENDDDDDHDDDGNGRQ
jgi:hypothetical protein